MKTWQKQSIGFIILGLGFFQALFHNIYKVS